MTQEVIKAKKIPVCRKEIVSSRNKAINVGFCSLPCNHMSEIRADRTCACCGNTIIRKSNYSTIKKRFDDLIQDNQYFIEVNKSWPTKQENRLSAWIKIDLYTYKVDINYLIQYADLVNNDELYKYETFFDEIKRVCPRILL